MYVVVVMILAIPIISGVAVAEDVEGFDADNVTSTTMDDAIYDYFKCNLLKESECDNTECCIWRIQYEYASCRYDFSSPTYTDDVNMIAVDDVTSTTMDDNWDDISSSINDDDDDDDDDNLRIILGSVIGGVCVIIMLGVCLIPMQRKKKKKRDSEQYLNTTAYGGLDFTTNNNCPTPNQTTRFDFEASVAARANTVASFNNNTLTSMTQVPTTTTDATVTTDNNHLKEGRVKGTTTAATTAAATEVVSTTATATATTAVATAVVTEITTPTNVHGTETVAVAVAVPIKTGITN